MDTSKIKVVTPQQVVRSHEKRVLRSLQEHRLTQKMFVHFPNRKRTPLLGQIGVWLVNKTGGIIATNYAFTGDTINNKSRQEK